MIDAVLAGAAAFAVGAASPGTGTPSIAATAKARGLRPAARLVWGLEVWGVAVWGVAAAAGLAP